MILIDFLKKAWTIVHGFDRFFEKSIDYSSWFLSKKSCTIIHGFDQKSWTIVHDFERFF